jgi:predicted  nucleic acid-binding Zn-ribbon protein
MKNLQEEIEVINSQLEVKCKELEDINNKITEWQMNINNEESNNGEALSELRVQREEIEI